VASRSDGRKTDEPRDSGRALGTGLRAPAPKPGKFRGHDPKEFLGKFVKLCFPVKDPRPGGKVDSEHMWVKVLREYEGDEDLVGELNNDPVFVCEYQCGDQLAFKVEEIEEVVDG
jgi:hypothetical protein